MITLTLSWPLSSFGEFWRSEWTYCRLFLAESWLCLVICEQHRFNCFCQQLCKEIVSYIHLIFCALLLTVVILRFRQLKQHHAAVVVSWREERIGQQLNFVARDVNEKNETIQACWWPTPQVSSAGHLWTAEGWNHSRYRKLRSLGQLGAGTLCSNAAGRWYVLDVWTTWKQGETKQIT